MRRAAIVSTLFVLALLGCNRSFTSTGTDPLGAPCSDPGQCASGVCVDGVCCANTCSGHEVCDAPGSRGVCTPRSLGAACTEAGACPTGFCVDGVCCDTACQGLCMFCALEGDAGTCLPVPDAKDPRHACGEGCSACYSGSCGAAEAGTDPHDTCGSGLVCGPDRQCAGANGTACDDIGQDVSCALGNCIGWRCLEYGYAHVDGYPFLPVDFRRTPVGAAVDPGGDAAVLVLTDEGLEQGAPTGNLVAVVAPSITGPWSEVGLSFNDYLQQYGAVAVLGHVAYFAEAYAPEVSALDDQRLGVVIYGITTDGRDLGYEWLDQTSALTQVTLAAHQGGLLVGELTPSGDLKEIARAPTADWSDVATVEHQVDAIASTTVNGRAVIFYLSQGALHAHFPDGTDVSAPQAFTGCGAGSTLALSSAPGGTAQVVSFAVTCPGGVTLGSYDPQAQGAQGWTFFAAPTMTPSNGLSGGDPWPVDQLVPCGGADGNLLFANLYPGAVATPAQFELDPGGFTSLFWLETDGGIAFAETKNPDSQYAYLAMAAAGGPNGTVLMAFDTAELVDGGFGADGGPLFATGPATLLLETVSQ
ncbi:MAG: hypothetical protein JST54_11890 [Deltaproteobacteria bacterium]|nr:hypothetical protein [Deltaproteobacteria bacterium]